MLLVLQLLVLLVLLVLMPLALLPLRALLLLMWMTVRLPECSPLRTCLLLRLRVQRRDLTYILRQWLSLRRRCTS